MLKAGMKDESDSDEVRMIVIVMKYVSRVILHLIIAVKNLLLIKRFEVIILVRFSGEATNLGSHGGRHTCQPMNTPTAIIVYQI